MGNVVRLLAFLFLAAFAAATLAPAAEAAAMAVEMADSGGCDGCPGCPGDDGDPPLCDQACMTSLPALPASLAVTVPAAARHVEAGTSPSPAGWSGPPDPSPPKVLLLS